MLVTLNDVLLPAQKGGYAVGLFNTLNLEMARGVLEAAETLRSPVIIGTAEVLLPYAPMENIADLLIPMARRAKTPVVVHYDHGLTYGLCMRALQLGFSSVMYDCSTDRYEENIRKVAELTRAAHALGATVEAELGHVGDNGADAAPDPSLLYTDVSQARDFAARTGVDALAVAVGTAHGAYKLPPKLDFQRIRELAAAIPTPLVLHGGSGIPDEQLNVAFTLGINKFNVGTEFFYLYYQVMKRFCNAGHPDFFDLPLEVQEELTNYLRSKMQLCKMTV